MSNLTDLLPAGAGGKQVDFVASGSIGNGVTVVLNSDGTVSVVAETPISQSIGAEVSFTTNIPTWVSATFDSLNNKVVVFYTDYNNSYYGTGIVGTVSGTSISFGSPTVFKSNTVSYSASAFDVSAGKVVVAYTNDSQGRAETVVGTVSGTSISFGASVVLSTSSGSYRSCVYDAKNQKIVIAFTNGADLDKGYAIVGTVSGTSISFGTAVRFANESIIWVDIAYSPVDEKVIIVYSGNTNGGKVVVGTVSGTSISYGTLSSSFAGVYVNKYNNIVYDTKNQKFVIVYRDDTSSYGRAIVGTISGTSVSLGTAVNFYVGDTTWINATYDENASKTVISFVSWTGGRLVVGEVSGTSISFNSNELIKDGSSAYFAGAYDSNNKKVVIAYQGKDPSNSSDGYARVIQPAYNSTNNTAFIGISDSAISDTATGSVTIKGGVSTNVTGLTPNTDYYVQADGSISTTVSSVPAGKALSSTSILLKG